MSDNIDIARIRIDPNDPTVTQGPILRVVVDGSGCGIEECGCSGDNYICISDGDVLLSIRLTEAQAQAIRAGEYHSG